MQVTNKRLNKHENYEGFYVLSPFEKRSFHANVAFVWESPWEKK